MFSPLFKTKTVSERHLDRVMAVEGQISRPEAEKLMELARRIDPGKVIVEIGTYRGRSTTALAYGSLSGNQCRVYAVDPHIEFTGVLGGKFGLEDQAELYHNLVKAGIGTIVAVVSLGSLQAARCWTEKNVGLLWIDGDHSYEGVRADFVAWSPFVADGGVIAFHDSQVPGVKQFISELMEQNDVKLLGAIESLSWFKKGRGDA